MITVKKHYDLKQYSRATIKHFLQKEVLAIKRQGTLIAGTWTLMDGPETKPFTDFKEIPTHAWAFAIEYNVLP